MTKITQYDERPEVALPLDGAKELFVRVLIGPDDGADKFTMLRLRVGPRGNTPRHCHAWEEEIFVLKGKGELISASGMHHVEKGNVVFLAGDEEHQFKNSGDSDLELLCLIPIRTG